MQYSGHLRRDDLVGHVAAPHSVISAGARTLSGKPLWVGIGQTGSEREACAESRAAEMLLAGPRPLADVLVAFGRGSRAGVACLCQAPVGNNVNQVARALNIAAHTGEYPPHQGQAAAVAAQVVRAEMRRLMAIYTGNVDYWGLPDEERPTSAPGALDDEQEREREAKARRRLRPRRRVAGVASTRFGRAIDP